MCVFQVFVQRVDSRSVVFCVVVISVVFYVVMIRGWLGQLLISAGFLGAGIGCIYLTVVKTVGCMSRTTAALLGQRTAYSSSSMLPRVAWPVISGLQRLLAYETIQCCFHVYGTQLPSQWIQLWKSPSGTSRILSMLA